MAKKQSTRIGGPEARRSAPRAPAKPAKPAQRVHRYLCVRDCYGYMDRKFDEGREYEFDVLGEHGEPPYHFEALDGGPQAEPTSSLFVDEPERPEEVPTPEPSTMAGTMRELGKPLGT